MLVLVKEGEAHNWIMNDENHFSNSIFKSGI